MNQRLEVREGANKDLNGRSSIRAEAANDPNLPPTPSIKEFLIKQENKLLGSRGIPSNALSVDCTFT